MDNKHPIQKMHGGQILSTLLKCGKPGLLLSYLLSIRRHLDPTPRAFPVAMNPTFILGDVTQNE